MPLITRPLVADQIARVGGILQLEVEVDPAAACAWSHNNAAVPNTGPAHEVNPVGPEHAGVWTVVVTQGRRGGVLERDGLRRRGRRRRAHVRVELGVRHQGRAAPCHRRRGRRPADRGTARLAAGHQGAGRRGCRAGGGGARAGGSGGAAARRVPGRGRGARPGPRPRTGRRRGAGRHGRGRREGHQRPGAAARLAALGRRGPARALRRRAAGMAARRRPSAGRERRPTRGRADPEPPSRHRPSPELRAGCHTAEG